MTINLESSLDQLARSVHDDEVAARMNGQVHRMVAQIRRRRAARYTATGVVSVGAVAAVAVAALQLADPDAPTPVAPATEGSDGDFSYVVTGLEGRYVCGEVAPEPPEAPDDALVLEGRVGPAVAYGDPVPLELTLINMLSTSVASSSLVDVVVLSDGVVVGTSSVDPLALGLIPGTDPVGVPAVTVVACGGDSPLDQGEYQMVATITLELSIGTTRTAVTDPMPFTITEAPASATDPFPACGSVVPSGDDPVLALDLALGERVHTPGDLVETVVTVRTANGRTVIGNAPVAGALIVLTRDGVVVGRGYSNAGDVDILDLAADQTVQVAATGLLSLCGIPQTDVAQDGLPAGTYQAYAVMEVMLQEVTEAGGEAVSRSDLIAARSNPVDITVGAP